MVVREGLELSGRRRHDDWRRDASGVARGIHHGHRGVAGGGRADGATADGHRRRHRACASGVAKLRQLHRGHSGDSSHGLRQRRVDHQQLLFSARRAEHRRPHSARWDERGGARQWRWRVRIPVRHVELLGSAGGHFRRPRRGRPRRPGLQHHPEDRRQHVQRDRLHELRRQVGTVEQHRRLPALVDSTFRRAAGAHQELRHQHRRGRTDSARPRVVLRQLARHRHLPGAAEPVRQPECGRPERLDVGERRQPERTQLHLQDAERRAPDVAGHSKEQVRVLHRLHEELQRRRLHGRRRAVPGTR